LNLLTAIAPPRTLGASNSTTSPVMQRLASERLVFLREPLRVGENRHHPSAITSALAHPE
jgi:hypothetical protein